MVSLWGSKKDDDPEADAEQSGNGEQTDPPAPRQSVEANERTRLLPPQQPHQGYLSPDDPAVRLPPDSLPAAIYANSF